MPVFIKGYQVDDEGIEFEIRDNQANRHMGDLFITETGLIWCPGKTWRANGTSISWERLAELATTINQDQ